MQDSTLFKKKYRLASINTLDVRTKVLFPTMDKNKKGGGIRQKITGLSRQARTRMFNTIRNMSDVQTLLTFTYPSEEYAQTAEGGDYMRDGAAVKYHLHKLRKWLNYNGYTGYWIMEFQQRGAPHFHCYLREPMTENDDTRLKSLWYKIVGSGDHYHLKRGVRVDKFETNGPELAAQYAAKYSNKSEQKEAPEQYKKMGRFWGIIGPKPPKPEKVIVPEKTINSAIRIANRYRQSRAKAEGYKLQKKVNGQTGHNYWNTANIARQFIAAETGIQLDATKEIQVMASNTQSELRYRETQKLKKRYEY